VPFPDPGAAGSGGGGTIPGLPYSPQELAGAGITPGLVAQGVGQTTYDLGSSSSTATAGGSSSPTSIFPTVTPGGTVVPASSGATSTAGGSAGAGTASGAGVAAGTSGNPLIDALEWAGNLLNLVPIVGPGIAKVLTDGVQAIAYVTHDLAYALDTAVSMFKPGQAWRFVFSGVTVALAWFAIRAWTGKPMLPSAPAVVPV
jgi:hypothetical protein